MIQPLNNPADGTQNDLIELGIEPQRIPSIVAMISRAEQSTSGSPPFNTGQAIELIETLDKAMSSKNITQCSKERFSRVLCQTCSSHRILPASYSVPDVMSIELHKTGSFADIYKGQHEENPVRLKVLRKQTERNMELIKSRLYCEIVAWKYISHLHVLPFLGIWEKQLPFSIVSPWMPNGNIVEYTERHPGTNRLRLLAQSACGLQYLHSIGIVHSDIHPGNVLITIEGLACLADFGISGIITDPSVVPPGSTTTSKRGLVCYMAPEQIRPTKFGRENSNPSKESDVHSLAMTAYEVLTGIQPYADKKGSGQIVKHIAAGLRPPHILSPWLPTQIWKMMESCWSENPSLRLTVSDMYHALRSSAEEVETDTGNGEVTTRTTENPSPPSPTIAPPEEKTPSQPPPEEPSRQPTRPLQPILEGETIQGGSATGGSPQLSHSPNGSIEAQPLDIAPLKKYRRLQNTFRRAFNVIRRVLNGAWCR